MEMKLGLNIFLIVAFFCVPCLSTRTETQTVEDDGTVKTVITDEWAEERTVHHDGRGRGHGDTIIIMTNDNENQVDQIETKSEVTTIEQKTIPVNRLYNDKLADYQYSFDPQEQTTLTQSGFKFDKDIGRIVAKREDFPECTDLVPIYKMSHDTCFCHGLVVHSGNVRQWESWGWKNSGVVGYGVLENGKCGASLHVRHMAINNADCKLVLHIQTTSDTEYNTLPKLGYAVSVAPNFYIWDSNDNFAPPPRLANSVEKKTVQLNRLYNNPQTDYDYSIDREAEAILAQGGRGYNFDKTMGRIVAKREDFPECRDLVPITVMIHDTCTCHGLVVNAGNVRQWEGWTWKDTGVVIGYGVLDKGKCGATAQVRHIGANNADCKLVLHFQTTSDTEYANYLKLGYAASVAPDFYIWGESDIFVPQPRPNAIDQKTTILNRLYNAKLADFDYSIDRQEEAILTQGTRGYKFDGAVGRIVTKKENFPDCPDLVPITKMHHDTCFCHGLVVNEANVRQWVSWTWKDAGVIGYGVLQKGKCGANVQVRHLGANNGDCKLVLHYQTASDTEYNNYLKIGYAVSVAPNFYIWEA
jgi:hypothetical protein